MVCSGEQEKESIFHRRVGQKNPSLSITVCHHSAYLAMPIGDPWDGFFYPTLTLMIYSYNPKLTVDLSGPLEKNSQVVDED